MKRKTTNPQFDEVFYFEVGLPLLLQGLESTQSMEHWHDVGAGVSAVFEMWARCGETGPCSWFARNTFEAERKIARPSGPAASEILH